MMQGYVCINSIYLFLIENIENEPLDISHSTYNADNKKDDDDNQEKKDLTEVVNKAHAFHSARIHSVLT
jgi:hypothetical protein